MFRSGLTFGFGTCTSMLDNLTWAWYVRKHVLDGIMTRMFIQ
jgi:hypothetical protein